MAEFDHLRGELERRLPARELRALVEGSLGLPPIDVPDDAPAGAVVRAVVHHCEAHAALPALLEALAHHLGDPAPGDNDFAKLRAEQALTPDERYAGFQVLEVLRTALPVGQTYLVARDGQRGHLTRLRRTRPEDAQRWLYRQRRIHDAQVEGVVAPTEVGRAPDGRPYAYRPYVPGESLHDALVERGPFTLAEADHDCRAVAATLVRLREQGLHHGALDPRAVLRAQDGRVLLLGAGLDALNEPGLISHPDHVGLFVLFDGLTRVAEGATYAERRPDAPAALAALVDAAFGGEAPALEQFTAELNKALSGTPGAELDEAAYGAAEEALRREPSDGAAALLERVAAPAREFERFIASAMSVLEQADEPERVRLWQRIGRVAFSELGDDQTGLSAYRAALELDAHAEAARAGVESILRSRGDWEALSDALIEKAEMTHDAQLRARTLREVARVREEKLGDKDGAFVVWIETLHEDPSDDSAARAIERLAAGDEERWNEALATLSELAQDAGDPMMAALWVRLGRWYAHKLERPDFALPCFSQAVTLDPAFDPAYEETIALYRASGSHRELVEVLERRADAHPNPARARGYRIEAAELSRTTIGDTEAALRLVRAVLIEDSAHRGALRVLRNVLEGRGAHEEIAEALMAAVEHAQGTEQARLYAELAEIREDHLGDAAGAIDGYRQAIAADARLLDAHKGLERILAREGRYDDLLACLHAQEQVASTPRQRVALFEHIGAIQEEEFVDVDAAIAAYERVVEIDAGHEGANPALARLYAQKGDHAALVRTLERHAEATKDAPRRHALWLRAANVYADELHQLDQAAALGERVIADTEETPQKAEALTLVARLREQRGDAEAAVEVVEKLAESASAPEERAGHWTRAGELLAAAGAFDDAIARYRHALDAQPGYRGASEGLRSLYLMRGDHRAIAAIYRNELEVTTGALRRAELLTGLGAVLADHLGAAGDARAAFEEALSLDPAAAAAARGLANVCWSADERTTAAEHYLTVLDRLAAGHEEERPVSDTTLVEMAVRAGAGFLEGGDAKRAVQALGRGLELAPAAADHALRRDLAEACALNGDAARAKRIYAELLDADGVDEGERYAWRIGFARAAVADGDDEGAQRALEAAADSPAADARALTELEALHREAERWTDVAATLERRIEAAPEGERGALFTRLGEVRKEHLGELEAAADAYVRALADSEGTDRNVLHKLMAVYTEARDWSKLVEVLVQIATQVDDQAQRGKYYMTAGTIAHDELGHLGQAVDLYGSAIEALPKSGAVHERLVKALVQEERWEDLKTEYARRLPFAEGKEQIDILVAVADLRQRHLSDLEGAIEVLEEAHHAAPTRQDILEMLAGGYGQTDKPMRAAPMHHALLASDPYRVESYHALRAAHSTVGAVDPSFLLCSVLSALDAASAEEQQYYEDHKATAAAVARACVTPALFDQHVRHPTQDLQLTAIVARIEPAMWIGRRRAHADYGLRPEDRRDAAAEQAVMARTLHYAAGVYTLPTPDVYLRPQEPGGLSTLLLERPSVGLGEAALAGGPEQALAFLCARQVALLRPGHGVREVASGSGDLKAWVLAAIALSMPGFPAPEDLAQRVERRRQALEAFLDEAQREDLAQQVKLLLEAAPQLDLKRYLAAVELGADRMGLVLANDVVVAKQLIEASPEGAVPRRRRIGELLRYAASEDYFAVRRVLGIAIT